MNKMQKVLLFFFIFLCYLYLKTGIHSDELIHSTYVPSWTIKQLLTLNFPDSPPLYMFYNLPTYYLDFVEYYLFKDNDIFYEVMKIVISFSSLYLFYVFTKDYISSQNAFSLAAIFILYPLHDSANYQLQSVQYLLISFALIVFSHALINKNKIKKGVLIGILGSFFSYASPPFVWGLSIMFLMKKEYKKFLFFVTPQIIYSIYIFIITGVLVLEKIRVVDMGNFSKFIKQFIFQIVTFIDVAIGPSFWLKIYYSITELSIASIIIGIFLVYLFFKIHKIDGEKLDFHLFYAFLAVATLSFFVFALTGYYPQTVFNLGNRVTVYNSLLLAFLVLYLLNLNKKVAMIVFTVLIFTVLGISDHWKEWNKKQKMITKNILSNQDILNFDTSKQLFVSHNQFSKLGTISHIEFFTEGAGLMIFRKIPNKDYKLSTINKRFYLEDDILIDRKYNTKFIVKDYIYVYNSESDKLRKIPKNEIQIYINKLPPDTRHWIQLIDSKFVNNFILILMPRLKYMIE